MFGLFQGGKSSHVLGLMSDVGAGRTSTSSSRRRRSASCWRRSSPRAHAGLGYDGGVGYGVAKWTKDPKLAADLVHSLTSAEALKAYSNDAGSVPSDTSLDLSNGGPALTKIVSEIKSGKPALHVALSAKTQEVMGRVSQGLLSGSVTVDDAVKQLAESDKTG